MSFVSYSLRMSESVRINCTDGLGTSMSDTRTTWKKDKETKSLAKKVQMFRNVSNIPYKKFSNIVHIKKIGKKSEGTKNKIGDKSAIPKKCKKKFRLKYCPYEKDWKNVRVPKTKLETNLQYPKKCKTKLETNLQYPKKCKS